MDYGVPYDFESIMHYPFTAFSKNGKPTIRNIVPMNGKVPYVELSDGDAKQTNAMYKCDGKDFKGAVCRLFSLATILRAPFQLDQCAQVVSGGSRPSAKEGACLTMNIEFFEENSGTSKKMRYFRKNKGEWGGGRHFTGSIGFRLVHRLCYIYNKLKRKF